MPIDIRIERWLDEWERRRCENPGLSPEGFIASLGNEVPAELLENVRRSIVALDWITEQLRQMKKRMTRKAAPPPRLHPHNLINGN